MLVVCALTFAGIITLHQWRQRTFIMVPLTEELANIEGVLKVEINDLGREKEINITLSEVEFLPETYQNIEEVLISFFKEENFKINLIDQRNTYLIFLYEKIHFALMEGERLGNYSKMNNDISLLLGKEKNLSFYRLWVDQKRIYVHLSSKDGFLFEIIPILRTRESFQLKS